MADFFNGATQVVNQTGGGNFADLLKNLGQVGQSFAPQESQQQDTTALVDSFIESILNKTSSDSAQDIISSQPVTSGNVDHNLGSVSSRLLGSQRGPAVPPLVLPPIASGGLPGNLGGVPGGPVEGGNLGLLNLSPLTLPSFFTPPIFSRQPF